MIRISSFAEKSDQAWRAFRAKQKLTPLHPGPPGRGIPFCFLVPALKRRTCLAPLERSSSGDFGYETGGALGAGGG